MPDLSALRIDDRKRGGRPVGKWIGIVFLLALIVAAGLWGASLLKNRAPEVEVGYTRGRRQVVATVREPVESLPLADLPRGGAWVVTGGGRGITAAAALELAKRYGLKLHLLGKSPAPIVDAGPWPGRIVTSSPSGKSFSLMPPISCAWLP